MGGGKNSSLQESVVIIGNRNGKLMNIEQLKLKQELDIANEEAKVMRKEANTLITKDESDYLREKIKEDYEIVSGFVCIKSETGSIDKLLEAANQFEECRVVKNFQFDEKNNSVYLHYECLKTNKPERFIMEIHD